ncbi:MAG: hypothetical protein ACOYN2_02075 [Patescibacteria group bacterium]
MKAFISLVLVGGLVGCSSTPAYNPPIQKPITTIESVPAPSRPTPPNKFDLEKRKKRLELIRKATERS